MNNMSKGYYEIKERIQQLKLSTEELKVYYRNADGSFSKSFPQILNILLQIYILVVSTFAYIFWWIFLSGILIAVLGGLFLYVSAARRRNDLWTYLWTYFHQIILPKLYEWITSMYEWITSIF